MPPFPVVSGQRQLAVIMFTDAVGFSARMHEQEVATLNRIERDTEMQKRIITAHEGTVLKSGDGMMIQFASAVQAVKCALEIQRLYVERESAGIVTTSLRYRIGIHVGDVFVGNGDVMGDGVNIAARLVTVPPPGGIVISQTVHDLVRNKVPLHLQRLGPRQLKNIKEAITIFQVLLDEPPLAPPRAEPAPGSALSAPAPAPAAVPPRWPRVVLLVGVAAALFLLARFLLRERSVHREELDRSGAALSALGDAFRESGKDAVQPASIAPADNPGSAGPDFAVLVTARPPPADHPAAEPARKSVAALRAWIVGELGRYSRDRPLYLTSIGRLSFPNAAIYTDANRQLYFAEGGAIRRREWTDLREPVQAAIIVSLFQENRGPVPLDIRRGAEAFAFLHGYPEMITALAR